MMGLVLVNGAWVYGGRHGRDRVAPQRQFQDDLRAEEEEDIAAVEVNFVAPDDGEASPSTDEDTSLRCI